MPKITIDMSDEDFERLTSNSTSWADSWNNPGRRADGIDVSWRRHVEDGRFEHSQKHFETEPASHWLTAYWVGPEWLNVMMCRSFLEQQGFEFEILLDLGTAVAYEPATEDKPEKQGRMPDYVILTDYLSPVWKKSEVKGSLEG